MPHTNDSAYRYLDIVTAVSITALLSSNLVASKTVVIAGFTIGVGIFVLVATLERKEGLDVYDHGTNFSPFTLEIQQPTGL